MVVLGGGGLFRMSELPMYLHATFGLAFGEGSQPQWGCLHSGRVGSNKVEKFAGNTDQYRGTSLMRNAHPP
jgi:hypothetical protein